MMWANNETGVLFPIDEIAAIVREKGVLFHTDAVQAVGKVSLRLSGAKINFLSLSGHKLHCVKGVGVLYINKRTRFSPYVIGGGQENGRRAGTQNVASIVGLGKACELAGAFLEHEATEVRGLRDEFENGVLARVEGSQVNGDRQHRLPNTSNLAFDGIDSEGVLMLLDQQGICCSSGSACTTGSVHASHVLKAMGFSDERARASLRFSFSRFNTRAEVARSLEILRDNFAVASRRRRSLSAGYCQVLSTCQRKKWRGPGARTRTGVVFPVGAAKNGLPEFDHVARSGESWSWYCLPGVDSRVSK
jgi:cysteine desulfurase